MATHIIIACIFCYFVVGAFFGICTGIVTKGYTGRIGVMPALVFLFWPIFIILRFAEGLVFVVLTAIAVSSVVTALVWAVIHALS